MYGILVPSGIGQVIEHAQDLIEGALDDLLRFLAPQLLHRRVIVFLRLGQEHFQNSSFVLQKGH